jgi:hypothetical protein
VYACNQIRSDQFLREGVAHLLGAHRRRADGTASVVVEVEAAQVEDASWRLAGAQA